MLQMLTTVWELELQKLGKGTAGLGHGVNKGTEVGKLLQKLNVFCTCVASLLFASPGSLAAVCSHQRKGLAVLRTPRDNEEGKKKGHLGVIATGCVNLGKSFFLPWELGVCSWMIGQINAMIFQVPFNFDILGL